MGVHMPLILLLSSWHPSQLLLETERLYLSPPSGLCSSPVLGRVRDKSKSKAQAVPKRTTFNPTATCPRGQDGGQLSWS